MKLMFWYSLSHASYLRNVENREYYVVIDGIEKPYTTASLLGAEAPSRWPDYQPIGIATLKDVKVA